MKEEDKASLVLVLSTRPTWALLVACHLTLRMKTVIVFIAASISVHFFILFFTLFLFCCFFTSSSFLSYSPPPSLFLLLCFASFSSMALACRLSFSRCPNTAAQKATSLCTPLHPLPLHRLVDQSKNCNSRTGTTDNPTRPAGQREEIWRDKDAYISCQKQGEGTKKVNSLHPPHDRLQFATPQGRPQALRH